MSVRRDFRECQSCWFVELAVVVQGLEKQRLAVRLELVAVTRHCYLGRVDFADQVIVGCLGFAVALIVPGIVSQLRVLFRHHGKPCLPPEHLAAKRVRGNFPRVIEGLW